MKYHRLKFGLLIEYLVFENWKIFNLLIYGAILEMNDGSYSYCEENWALATAGRDLRSFH